MMKMISTIIVILLAQCVHLQPTLGILEKISNNSCVFGNTEVSIFLYNRENVNGTVISLNQTRKEVHPNKTDKIAFTVHGFISEANYSTFLKLSKKLVERDYTVLAVDWSNAACTNGLPLVKFLEYPSAVQNTREIGEMVAEYLEELSKEYSGNFLLIGHSLGAHVCGFAAKHYRKIQQSNIKKLSKSNITHIIGLDPAAPMFSQNECAERLCREDAHKITIFKTSSLGFSCTSNGESVGSTNWQFGNGRTQPDCNSLNVSCSHSKSIVYLINILENVLSTSTASSSQRVCPKRNTTNCTLMNEKVLKGDMNDGNYHVYVNESSPYHEEKNSFSCQQ